jgi:drug/metabolite transporter (DMT)-like permease
MKEGAMKEMSLFVVMILTWAAGQVLLKFGMNLLAGQRVSVQFFFKALTMWQVIAGLLCSVVGSLMWLVVISRFNLGFSNLVVSLTFVLVALASAVIFKEPMPLLKWMGAMLIVLGVFLVSQTR